MKLNSILKNASGISILEVTIGLAIMAGGAVAMMAMNENSLKGVGAVENKIKRDQLKTQIIQQFLSNPNHCKCLFTGLPTFSAPESGPGLTLSAPNVSALGRFKMNADGTCGTIPTPIISKDIVIDGFLAKDIKLTDVTGFGSLYSGNLTIEIESKKKALGPPVFGVKIPITIQTVVDGSNVRFNGCGAKIEEDEGSGTGSGFSFDPADGVGLTLVPRDGNSEFRFSGAGLPANAKAIMISWVIGTPSNGRSDRKCTISGAGNAIVLGTDSKGDGGQKMVAGTAFIPMNQCGPMTMTCKNNNSAGLFTVLAVIKDEPNCQALANASSCSAGEIFVASADGSGSCVPIGDGLAAATCQTGQVLVDGQCYTTNADGTVNYTSSSTPTTDTSYVFDASVLGNIGF